MQYTLSFVPSITVIVFAQSSRLKWTTTLFKQVHRKYKPLLNNAICSKPDQNRIKSKKATVVCIVDNLNQWKAAILGCVTSHSPH